MLQLPPIKRTRIGREVGEVGCGADCGWEVVVCIKVLRNVVCRDAGVRFDFKDTGWGETGGCGWRCD